MKSWLFLLLMALNLPLFGQYRCASRQPSTGPDSAPARPLTAIEARGMITIPIVIHILWFTPSENLTDAQIQSQIDVLNEDFRALNNGLSTIPPVFASDIADMEIEFCLVAVTRTRTPFPNVANLYSDGQRRACHTLLGGHDALDPEHYLNAWVCSRSDNACGEGTFPGDPGVPADEQGIFIRPDCFGTTGTAAAPFNLGRTATHEIGHYLNLKHLWGEGLEDPLCQSDDMVDDTPEQAYSYSEFTGEDCPSHPSFSCGSADLFMNFMNLPADRCMSMFTNGQRARAHAAIQTFRPGLLEASCLPVGLNENEEETEEPLLLQNPSSAGARLLLPQKDRFEIAIFDASGRLVFNDLKASGGFYALDPGLFINGIYYIKIRNGRKIHVKKLIIAR